jgi:hypothetical protein
VYALGTVTAFKVEITDSGATTLAQYGGQIGGATNGSLPAHIAIAGPIVCVKSDQPQVVVTATGATSTSGTVNYHVEVS